MVYKDGARRDSLGKGSRVVVPCFSKWQQLEKNLRSRSEKPSQVPGARGATLDTGDPWGFQHRKEFQLLLKLAAPSKVYSLSCHRYGVRVESLCSGPEFQLCSASSICKSEALHMALGRTCFFIWKRWNQRIMFPPLSLPSVICLNLEYKPPF